MPEIILKNVRKEFGNKFVAVDNLNMVIEDRSFITLWALPDAVRRQRCV